MYDLTYARMVQFTGKRIAWGKFALKSHGVGLFTFFLFLRCHYFLSVRAKFTKRKENH